MKKFIIGLLPVVISTLSVASAWIINQKDVQTPSSCNPAESHDVYYYIPSDKNITIYPDDTYWNTNDVFISKNYSSVDIYRNGVISQCSDWDRLSNFVRGWSINPPKYPALIFRNDDGCVLSKPNYTKTNNPTVLDAQIHYTVWFHLIWWGVGQGKGTNSWKFYYVANGSKNYTCYPDWKQVSSNSSCEKSSANYWLEPDYHLWECLNYRVFWCGDGLINRPDWTTTYNNWTYNEECDPNNPEWKNGKVWQTCNPNTCKIEYSAPVCSSSYNGKTQYTASSDQWLKNTDKLCDEWEVDYFDFSPKTWWPRTYTWNCKNGLKNVSCSAKQQRCGDGEKNGNEQCDDGEKNGTSASSCSKTCTTVGGVSCGTKDGWTTYFDTKRTTAWLNKTDAEMCGDGMTVWNISIVWSDFHLEWTCNNENGSSTTCKAYQEYCGDGERNGGEQCDYNDEKETNWWNDWCDMSCKQKNQVSKDCDDVFHYTLRHGWEYTFYDKFIPSATRFLYDFSVKFEEQKDYNRWTNPLFYWMDDLWNGAYKEVSSTRRVLYSSPKYQILDHPDVRSENNLYIEFNISSIVPL